jgi:DNA (cytosine-5)-methyltransferase 1
MTTTLTTLELKLGTNRGKPRIWIEGRALLAAGFAPGMAFHATFEPARITLKAGTVEGVKSRTVSGKIRASGPHPIIDINTIEIFFALPGVGRIALEMGEGIITIIPASLSV